MSSDSAIEQVSLRVRRYQLLRYGVPFCSVALALLLTVLLPGLRGATVFALFYAAVALSTWSNGLWSGLVATALSIVVVNHFLLTATGLDRVVPLVVFVLVTLLLNSLNVALRSALQQSEVALAKLKASADALRETQALFESFVSQSPATAFIKDEAGRYLYVNQQAECLFHRKLADWIGKTDFAIFPLQTAQQLRENDLAILSTGRMMQILETVPQNDGEHYYRSFKFPLKDGSGRKLLGGMAVDITQQKRLETKLNQLLAREQSARSQAEAASRAKDEFLAIVSHELRTPLSAILGWAELLLSGKLDEVKTSQALEAISRNAQVQKQLIEDLLDIARIVRGQVCLHLCPTSLIQVIAAALVTVCPTADTKMVHLESLLDPSLGLVNGDPDRLQQVVWNLLSNAVKFTPMGGRVEIRLLRVDDCAQIKVIDTGQGISPDFLPYVFERFSQAESPTTRRQSGLGLGLAIARNLVELHGGTIQAESPGLGQGATFIVQLPLMEC